MIGQINHIAIVVADLDGGGTMARYARCRG